MDTEKKTDLKCKNCGQPVIAGERGIIHDHMLMRCKPWESGQPYGLVAELPDEQ